MKIGNILSKTTMQVDKEKLLHVLKDNLYMTLATASKSGEPWITPLCFAYDEEVNIFWCSQNTARHSININENPRIAISVFNSALTMISNFPAIYISGKAQEVSVAELDYAVSVYDERMELVPHRVRVNPDDAFTSYPLKMYKAVPDEIFTLQASSLHFNEWIDKRITIGWK